MKTTGGNSPIPTTTKGFKIYPRTYIIWTRASQAPLKAALRNFIATLNTTSEFLKEWQPNLQLQQLDIPNNYQIILKNVSSKEIRTQLTELLIDLKKKSIIMPREGMILQAPYKANVYLELATSTNNALKALLSRYRADHETFSRSSTNIRLNKQTKNCYTSHSHAYQKKTRC